MSKDNWHGLMKILEIAQYDIHGNLKWKDGNIHNIFHSEGEEFMLRAAFTGGRVSSVIPDNYYLGLDNRTTVSASQTMEDIAGEPSTGGYTRQEIASTGDFAVNFESGHYVATSPIVAFRSTTVAWGPVKWMFLTNKEDGTGSLISTATLSRTVVVDPGDSVTMRIGMVLRPCS